MLQADVVVHGGAIVIGLVLNDRSGHSPFRNASQCSIYRKRLCIVSWRICHFLLLSVQLLRLLWQSGALCSHSEEINSILFIFLEYNIPNLLIWHLAQTAVSQSSFLKNGATFEVFFTRVSTLSGKWDCLM